MREPTVGEYLEAARQYGMSGADFRKKVTKLAPDGGKRQRGFRSTSKREQEYRSVQEKQKAKGKPPAAEWKVQSAKGGAFCLVHRESGDFYADYVSTPITSWGAKRFPTAQAARDFRDDPKHFTQPARRG